MEQQTKEREYELTSDNKVLIVKDEKGKKTLFLVEGLPNKKTSAIEQRELVEAEYKRISGLLDESISYISGLILIVKDLKGEDLKE